MTSLGQGLPPTPFNPYVEDPTAMGNSNALFQQQNAYAAPLQPVGRPPTLASVRD